MRHQSVSIKQALKLTDRQLGAKLGMDGAEARKALKFLRSQGDKFIRVQGCDNFDPKEGACLGHGEDKN